MVDSRPGPVDPANGRRWPVLLFFCLCVLSLAAQLARVHGYYFNNDDVHVIGHGKRLLAEPSVLFRPDRVGRIHPVLYGVLGTLWWLFGWQPLGYYAVLFGLHLLTVAAGYLAMDGLLSRSARLWGLSVFLVASVHFQSVGWITALGHVLGPGLVLLSLIGLRRYWRSGRRTWLATSVAVWVLAVWAAEEAFVGPVLFALVGWTTGEWRRPAGRRWIWAVPFAIAAAGLCLVNALTMEMAAQTVPLGWGLHMFQNLLGFGREILQMWLVPRREIVAWTGLPTTATRLGLTVLASACLGAGAMRARHRLRARRHVISLLLAWFAVAVGPFLWRPMGWVPQARYLYHGALPACLGLGLIADELWQADRRRRWRLGVAGWFGYCLTINSLGFGLLVGKLQIEARWQDPPGLERFIAQVIPVIRSCCGPPDRHRVLYLGHMPLDAHRTEPVHLEAAVEFYYGPELAVEQGEPASAPPGACVVVWERDHASCRSAER